MHLVRLFSQVLAYAMAVVAAGLALAAFDAGRAGAAFLALAAGSFFFLTLLRDAELEHRIPLRSQVLDEFEGQFME